MITIAELTTMLLRLPTVPPAVPGKLWIDGGLICYSTRPIFRPEPPPEVIPGVFILDESVLDGPDVLI